MNANDNNFFGRSSIIDTLKKRVVGLKEGYRQNVALIGNHFVGKSSILQHFASNLDDNSVSLVYLDLEHKDFEYFLTKYIGSLLYSYSKNISLPLYEDLELLLESLKNKIPNTIHVIRKIREDFRKGKIADSYLGLLTLPEIFTNESGQHCILIFDEFQHIETYGISAVFQTLGQKIMTQKKCFYVFSSSYQIPALRILSEKLSLLFGSFEIINVDAFETSISQKFIEHTLKEIKIGMHLKSILTDFSGGHPLYMQLICREMYNLAAIHRQNEIYLPLMAQAIENTIFDRWGVISRHFELMIQEVCAEKDSQYSISLLLAIASGYNKLDNMLERTGLKKSQLTKRIQKLIDYGFVVKNGSIYFIKDKLFRYWIKFVYEKRLKDVDLAPDNQRRQFKEEFSSYVDKLNLSLRQNFTHRVVDLIDCFDNDSLDLNGRKYKLPVISEILPDQFRINNGMQIDVIKAKTLDGDWYIIIKKEMVNEQDVNSVIEKLKGLQRRPKRCLIVSLADLEENAKLRALQERFWIWNEGELNVLLNLFDKPYIL